jgi:hypothetical protein
MTERKTLKQEMAVRLAKKTREARRGLFDEVCKKGKVETAFDVIGVFHGLSRRAVEAAAIEKIMRLAGLMFTPEQIVKYMEPK